MEQNETQAPRLDIVTLSLVFYSLVLALAVTISWYRTGDLLVWPTEGSNIRLVLLGVVAGCVVGVVVALMSRLLLRFEAWRALMVELRTVLGPLSAGQTVVLALTSGVAEEALFRGALQPWLGITVAALAFGAIHAPLTKALRPWPLFAAVVGFAFGLLCHYAQSWLAAASAHGMVNYLNLRFICGNGAFDAGTRSENPTGVS